MFTILSLEDNKQTTFEPTGSIRLWFSKKEITFGLVVSGKNIPIDDDFSPNISLVSEWLELKPGALPKNDINKMGELNIKECPLRQKRSQ